MLYLVGGASRAGKTIIAERLLEESGIPYFCLDHLNWGLAAGIPEFGLNTGATNIDRGRKLWPVMRGMYVDILEAKVKAYCVEGDCLLPEHVTAISERFPGQVRGCFLGYAHTDPQQKLSEIRQFVGHTNDWLNYEDDDYVLNYLKEMIGFSRCLEDSCAQAGVPYFETSQSFSDAIICALSYLKTGTLK